MDFQDEVDEVFDDEFEDKMTTEAPYEYPNVKMEFKYSALYVESLESS